MLPETPASMNPRISRHPHGIVAVDTEYLYPGHAAAHIIQQNGRAAFVDVGTNYSVPYLLAALEELGVERAAVDYVFLTHVHLDHAGGAGLLIKSLPNALAVLHPRGAPHMIDPEKLIAGSKVVYGEKRFTRLYGQLVPIPADRVRVVKDGEHYDFAGRDLQLIHTPGHAMHHYAIVDGAHASIFPGDTFGISYRQLDTSQGAFITPTTTPTQFDPEQLIASIDRMLSFAPESMYLMHYSRVRDVPRLAESLRGQIREFVAITERHRGAGNRYDLMRSDMLQLWLRLARKHGCTQTDAEIEHLLGNDLDLNTQGLLAWDERRRKGGA